MQTIKLGDIIPLDDKKKGSSSYGDWLMVKVPNDNGNSNSKMAVFVSNVADVKDDWLSAKITDMSVSLSNKKQDDGSWQKNYTINVTLEQVAGETRKGFMDVPDDVNDINLPFN